MSEALFASKRVVATPHNDTVSITQVAALELDINQAQGALLLLALPE